MRDNPSSGHRRRLKDRFQRSSLQGFHDYEIIEILLTYAIPRRDVKPLAKKLLSELKGLKGVFEAAPGRLKEVSGLGESSAVLFALVRETARIYLSEQRPSRMGAISSPKDAVRLMREASGGEAGEGLFAFYLNSKNEVLGVEVIHKGEVARGDVSPRAVIQKAFSHNARSIILVHAKPGKAAASRPEKELAREIEAAASSIDILVHDYIVAGAENHVSARDAGWLKPSVCP